MFKNDKSKATVKLTVEIKNKQGEVIDIREVKNLVVDDGLEYIASRMKDATATAMSHMAIGTGSSAAAASDTALGTEAARVALTSTQLQLMLLLMLLLLEQVQVQELLQKQVF